MKRYSISIGKYLFLCRITLDSIPAGSLRFIDCGQLKGLEGLSDLPTLDIIDLTGCTSLENVDALGLPDLEQILLRDSG